MNLKTTFHFLSVLTIFTLNVSLGYAQDQGIDYLNLDKPIFLPAEAGRAVFGRIFGVKGEGDEIQYHVFDLTQRSPKSALIRSVIVPGWGQAFNQQRKKGGVFLFGFLTTAVGSYVVRQQANQSYDEYKNKGSKDDSLYSDYEDERSIALVLGISAGALWIASMFDAYKSAYDSLYSVQDHSMELAYFSGKTQVRWKKRF
ncbi:MAG: DUF5683 domain-containing protein [Elusimicrobiota bacterium]